MTTPLPPPLDQDAWDEAATEYAVGSLERIRGSAEKWVGTISTLVGLFGTVVVFAGPEALTDIAVADGRYAVFFALASAAVLAGAAIVVGALAAQTSTRVWDNWNGATLAAYIAHHGNVAAKQLAASRWLGAGAASLVLATALFATWASLDDSSEATATTVVVVIEDGSLVCGALTSDDGQARVGGRPIDGALQVVVVDDC